MADSIEQRIIDLVVARMQTIDGTGDMLTDVGTRSEDSRATWQQDELPAISVFEGPVTSEEADDEGRTSQRTMPVMIKAFFNAESEAGNSAAFARKAISDIFRAIRSDDQWIDDDDVELAVYTGEKSHAIDYDNFEITGVQVEIEIVYRGSKFNLEA